MPYQVIYSSESATPMQMDDLEEILESARESNAEVGITGALVYVDGFFLQILEGEPDEILQLMARISRDLRHEAVTVLRQGEVPTAHFIDWKMAYVSATAEQVAKWVGLSTVTSVPDILADLNSDALKVTRMTEHILHVLAAEPNETPGAG